MRLLSVSRSSPQARISLRTKSGLMLSALTLGLMLMQGEAMAKMVIFSAVQGQVLLAGKPVVGAVLERRFNWGWKDENGGDSAQTNAAGEFSLPLIERSSFLGAVLPHEPVIRQQIDLRHEGKTYEIWMHIKRDYERDTEGEGKPIRVRCQLDAQPAKHGKVMGLCEFL